LLTSSTRASHVTPGLVQLYERAARGAIKI